jgi:redox-sensitive bicupin YhaK (pirin superfamily)
MSVPPIERVIEGLARDIGGFPVTRVLPAIGRRAVGPFVFLDHMGPTTLAAGQGLDVRPHPHIGLATVTYLFSGEIVHRDSLGYEQTIQPGDINWMNAGRGIVHSERTDPRQRVRPAAVHGLQLWVALPREEEESAPTFAHHPQATLPAWQHEGVSLRLLAGHGFGRTTAVHTLSPLLYVDAELPADTELEIPPEHAERALYVVEGQLQSGETRVGPQRLLVLAPEVTVRVRALEATRVVLLGGAPLDGPRHMWWNFVSSDRERIERAKRQWAAGEFAAVTGDDEFIPLPER